MAVLKDTIQPCFCLIAGESQAQYQSASVSKFELVEVVTAQLPK